MRSNTIRNVAAPLVSGLLIAGASWQASAAELVNATGEGIAIEGYDPVAYFTAGRPVRGTPEDAFEWPDREWLFANGDHREAFAAEPGRYAPRYGGFCAGAMAKGFQAPIDPEAFAIIDGRLYLAFSKDAIDGFEENSDENIPTADENWQALTE